MFLGFSNIVANIDNIDYIEVMTPRHANNNTDNYLILGVKILKGCEFHPNTTVEDTTHKYVLCEANSHQEITEMWNHLTRSLNSRKQLASLYPYKIPNLPNLG